MTCPEAKFFALHQRAGSDELQYIVENRGLFDHQVIGAELPQLE